MRSAHARFRDSAYYLTLFSFSLSLRFSSCFSSFSINPLIPHISPLCCYNTAARVSHWEKNRNCMPLLDTYYTRDEYIESRVVRNSDINFAIQVSIFVIIHSECKRYQRASRHTSNASLVQFSKVKNSDICLMICMRNKLGDYWIC